VRAEPAIYERGARRRGLALGVALALAACSQKPAAPAKPTPEAGFIVVRQEPVQLSTVLAGRTAAFEMSEVRPQVSGLIRARQFTEGSFVRAGQTLYQIDQSIYQASAAQAQANLASAEAARSAAAALANRYRPLAQMQAISQQDYTNAAAQERQAAASVAQNRAQVQTARINLRFTRVPAPISGRIGRSTATTGALVTANQTEPLTTIQRLDPMFVDIQQSSTDLLRLRQSAAQGGAVPGKAAVRLTLEDGSAYGYTGELQFTEAMVDPNTGAVTLRARFPNPQGLLLPGMYVRATLVQDNVPQGILIPQPAVSRDVQGNATVMIVGPGNKAVRKQVSADRTVGDKWLVTAGLAPGDKVIVEGLGKVRPGAAIVAVPAGSKPRPAGRAAGTGGGAAGTGGGAAAR
jgi:membrane fusion protein, multidrug efflux system